MKPYRILVADCPWKYNDRRETRRDNPGRKTTFGLGASDRYEKRDGCGGMSISELKSLREFIDPVVTLDAYMFFWATCPMLVEGIEVMESWGFKYKTVAFQWTKLTKNSGVPFFGPGRYTPSNMEVVLLGVKGRPWHPSTGEKPDQEVRVPHPRDPETGKIIHSRKPEEIQDRIDAWLGPHLDGHPKAELFATRPKGGWDCMGYALYQEDIRETLKLRAEEMQ